MKNVNIINIFSFPLKEIKFDVSAAPPVIPCEFK